MFPHELLGFETDDPEGILLSIAILNESTTEAKKRAGVDNPQSSLQQEMNKRRERRLQRSGTGN